MWQKRNLNRAVGSILAVAPFWAGGCSSIYPVDVQSAWGPGVKFTNLGSTFDWAPDAQVGPGSPRAANPQVHELVLKTVTQELTAKGYEKISAERPDFRLDYRVGMSLLGDTTGDGTLQQYPEGSLVLYVIDPASGKWIWRSAARARLNESGSPEPREKWLRQVVQQMLKDFPSRGGKPPAAR